MKRSQLRGAAPMAVAALFIAGCSGLGKMTKHAETIKYTVEPNPLIVQGDSVAVSVRGNFPAKYFSKKATVELTPSIDGIGESMLLETPEGKVPENFVATSSTALKMVGFQGEGAAGNYTVIPYESGKEFTHSDKVAYTPAMEHSALMVKILGKQGKKEKPFPTVKVADGVITTPYLVKSDDKTIMAKDAFQRITSHTQDLQLNYNVASDVQVPGDNKEQDVKDLQAFLKDNAKNPNIVIKGVKIDAYASPEGEVDMNEGLANKRDKAAMRWMQSELGKNKLAKGDSLFAGVSHGEDWTGFERELNASSFADKDLVLRVLTMYADVNKRESEIKNMAATYTELRSDILPKLRRAEIQLNYDRVGKTDEQLTSMSRTMPDSLNVEELLFAATLTQDMNEQLRIYKECERVHPADYRAANNVGYIYMQQNKLAEAEAQFTKANSITDNPISTNNLGVCARLKGDRKKAAELYAKAGAAGPEVKYNQGIIDIQNGNYSSANSNFSGSNGLNVALAKTLSGDAAGAQRALEASPDKDTAEGHYLMAIIGARQNNGDMVKNNLSLAVQKNAALGDKAKKDLEFRAFKNDLGI
ncbi:MAG: hypothetical protein KA175_08575 [Flavobacteriales bacterium]|nr:hypothetical protein [Flavobacteriales bacterium]MBP6697657.1 hypothetical protein [Flavobacteriales bacterium]